MEAKVGGRIFTFCILISVLFRFYYQCAHDIYNKNPSSVQVRYKTAAVGIVEACRKQEGPWLPGEKMPITQELAQKQVLETGEGDNSAQGSGEWCLLPLSLTTTLRHSQYSCGHWRTLDMEKPWHEICNFQVWYFLWSLNIYTYIQIIYTSMWVCVYIHLTFYMPVKGGLNAGPLKTGIRDIKTEWSLPKAKP